MPLTFIVSDGSTFEENYQERLNGTSIREAFALAMMDSLELSTLGIRPSFCNILSTDVSPIYINSANLSDLRQDRGEGRALQGLDPASVVLQFNITFDTVELAWVSADWPEIKSGIEESRSIYVDNVNARLNSLSEVLDIESLSLEVWDVFNLSDEVSILHHNGWIDVAVPDPFSDGTVDDDMAASAAIIMAVIVCICALVCIGRMVFVFYFKNKSKPQKSPEPIVTKLASEASDGQTVSAGNLPGGEYVASTLPDQAAGALGGDMEVTRSWCADSLFQNMDWVSAGAKTTKMNGEPQAYMEDNDKCEYFSRTLGRWHHGHMQTKVDPRKAGQFMYTADVSIGKQWQKQKDVGLGELRSPLKEGDLVEVLLESKDKKQSKWTPGTIVGIPCAMRGADVRLDGPTGSLVKEMMLVRRRFAEGATVGLYKGPLHGWVDAIIDSTRLPGEPAELAEMKEKAQKVGEFLTVGRYTDAQNGDISAVASTPAGSAAINNWTLVPVRGVESQASFLIPSFLVRNEVEVTI